MTARKRATLARLHEEIAACAACPRLVAWREQVAREKRRAYREEVYWGRPVPGFGDPAARLVIAGLAPGAHGANRTGRAFTGDRSGDFLFAALHRCGLASQPTSERPGDGLTLREVFITLACRCAPPDNHPSREELVACEPFLAREIALLPEARAFLALGKIAYDALAGLSGGGVAPFAHGGETIVTHPADLRPRGRGRGEVRSRAASPPARTAPLFASYHVSQQNTQTGRLTPAMFDDVLRRAARAAGLC